MEDPRREAAVHKLDRPKTNPDEVPPDMMGLVSMLAGMVGLMMRNKIAAWIAIIASISSIARMKTAEMDVKQVIISLTFSVMGLIMNYFGVRFFFLYLLSLFVSYFYILMI